MNLRNSYCIICMCAIHACRMLEYKQFLIKESANNQSFFMFLVYLLLYRKVLFYIVFFFSFSKSYIYCHGIFLINHVEEQEKGVRKKLKKKKKWFLALWITPSNLRSVIEAPTHELLVFWSYHQRHGRH